MSHHSSQPWPFPGDRAAKALEDAERAAVFREAMKKTLGEYPEGRLNADDAGAVPLMIENSDGKVILRFPKPVAWIGFTGDQAMEIAQMLIKHARAAGVTAPVVLRIGE